MFENWTRKLSAFALLVWAFAVVWRLSVLRDMPSLTEIATSAAIIVAVAAGKSIGTDFVKGHGNGGDTQ
jgi:hypothetical protein